MDISAIAATITALGVILGAVFAAYKWFLKQEKQDTIITEFDPEKVEKFITKVIVRRWTVTFVFYNGVEITRAYTNGPSGNQVGWKQKKEVTAWQ